MRYQSTPEKEFDGDIIITDPCYIIRNENGITKNDWHYCEYGEYMERLGIKNYLTHDTIYGDWGCTVFDSDTKKPLGRFCADAGLVSVFLLHDNVEPTVTIDAIIKPIYNFKAGEEE